MFKCLILLADSVSFGKQIIYSLPEHISTPKFFDVGSVPQKFRRNPVSELLTQFLSLYDYFGDFNSKNLYGGYCEDVFINCFSGSAKYPQLCITINKHILICKTITFKIEDNGKSSLNSINLIGIIQEQQHMESAKYLINFFANILEIKEKEDKLLSKQIALYDVRHSEFAKGIKDLITKYHRPNEQDYWYQIEATLLQEVRDLNKKGVGDIEAVQLLKKFWQSVSSNKQFHYENFHTHTGLLLLKPPPEGLLKNHLYKSLLFSKTRIKETLGSFYTKERARLIQKYLHSNKNLKQMIKQYEIDVKQLQQLLSILISNDLAVFINPIRKSSKYISCLRETLKHSRMKQFQELFSLPFVETLKSFQGQKSSGSNVHYNQIRFLLLNGLIKDLNTYIYDKENPEQLKEEDRQIYEILKQYSYSGVSIEEIAGKHSNVIDTLKIRSFLNQHRSHVGIYYVQQD